MGIIRYTCSVVSTSLLRILVFIFSVGCHELGASQELHSVVRLDDLRLSGTVSSIKPPRPEVAKEINFKTKEIQKLAASSNKSDHAKLQAALHR